jgi:hypothetical protein
MVCISELRGLEKFQSRHPEVVVVAVSITNDRTAIESLLRRQKLTLRTAVGEDWQGKFGLSEAIPATVLVEAGRVRIVHSAVMPDPVAELEADLAAMHDGPRQTARETAKQPTP